MTLKRYLLEHRVSRRRMYVVASSFQQACGQVGWFPNEVCLLKIEKEDAEHGKGEDSSSQRRA